LYAHYKELCGFAFSCMSASTDSISNGFSRINQPTSVARFLTDYASSLTTPLHVFRDRRSIPHGWKYIPHKDRMLAAMDLISEDQASFI